MGLRQSPHQALGAALIKAARPANADIESSTERPWASITFSGHRHKFAIHLGGPEAESMARFMARTIACDEFDISGHIVADIIANPPRADRAGFVLDIEALTVEAA